MFGEVNDMAPAVHGLSYVRYHVANALLTPQEKQVWTSVQTELDTLESALRANNVTKAIQSLDFVCEKLNINQFKGLAETYVSLQDLYDCLKKASNSSETFQNLSNWWFNTIHFYRDTTRMSSSNNQNKGNVLYRGGIPPHFLMVVSIFLPFLLLLFGDPLMFSTRVAFSIFAISLVLSAVFAALTLRFVPSFRGTYIAAIWLFLFYIIPPNFAAFLFWVLNIPSPPDSIAIPIVLIWMFVAVCGGLMIMPFMYVFIRKKSRQYGVFGCVWIRRNSKKTYDFAITDSHDKLVYCEEVKKPSRFLERFVGHGLSLLELERLASESSLLWFRCYVAMTAPRHVMRFGKNKGRELLDTSNFFFHLGKSFITENIFPDAALSTPGLSEKSLREYFVSNPPCCEPPGYEEYVASQKENG